MRTINLKSIIEAKGLDVEMVAQQLFPTNQYSRLALNRVIAGKGELDASQISKFALLADCSIEDLYGDYWECKFTDGVHTFSNKDYVAELNTKTWTTKIFHKNSMIHESVIHGESMPISTFLKTINQIINENN